MPESAATHAAVERVLAGNRRAAGRVISAIENGSPGTEEILKGLYSHTGRAYTIGITGPPGAGKSTVVDELIRVVREQGKSVGVLAVDPNSPFSGGAILGDRIRMMRHTLDEGVLIRSMGARGHLGGLALAAGNALQVMDAMGLEILLAETVGVGQSELEIAGAADTTVVVIPPGLGDGVQAIKAGIMEVADIFVVNKADQPHADKVVADIRDLLRMDINPGPWTPPIVRTVATRGEGVEDLWLRIRQHRHFLEGTGELRRRRVERARQTVLEIAEARLRRTVLAPQLQSDRFQELIREVADRAVDPFTAAEAMVPDDAVRAGKKDERC